MHSKCYIPGKTRTTFISCIANVIYLEKQELLFEISLSAEQNCVSVTIKAEISHNLEWSIKYAHINPTLYKSLTEATRTPCMHCTYSVIVLSYLLSKVRVSSRLKSKYIN